MIKDGGNFVAHDAKSGEDITRSVLTRSSSSKSIRAKIFCQQVLASAYQPLWR